MKTLGGFFKNKRILVTGHTGFKGAWLTQMLLELGAQVCGYALKPNTRPSLFRVLKLEKKIQHTLGDIRNLRLLKRTIKKFSPEIIFHLAAQPLVRDSYDDPHYTHEVNIMGTVNILEAIRENKIRAGVIITTDKVYQNKGLGRPFQEDDPLAGYDPYSCSKASADLVVSSYQQSFFNPAEYGRKHQTLVASVRAGNIIGGGDWAKDRLVPDLVRAVFVNRKKLIIRSPQAVRPWQHVLEPLFGYLLLAQFLYQGDAGKSGAWNFGPDETEVKNVESVVKQFAKVFGQGGHVIKHDKIKHEAKLLRLKITKAKRKLGWKPRLGLETAINQTASWYQIFYTQRRRIQEFTLNQIRDYLGEIKS